MINIILRNLHFDLQKLIYLQLSAAFARPKPLLLLSTSVRRDKNRCFAMLDDVQRRWNRWRRSLDENHDFMTHDDIGSTKSLTFASTSSTKFRLTKNPDICSRQANALTKSITFELCM